MLQQQNQTEPRDLTFDPIHLRVAFRSPPPIIFCVVCNSHKRNT